MGTSARTGDPPGEQVDEVETDGAEPDEGGEDGEPGEPGRPRPWRDRPLSDTALAVTVAVVTLPILWMGYGTDIDVANVLEATEALHSGSYEPSRTPGVPVFEAIVAVLDPIGGHLLVNLATAAAAAALAVGIARLVRMWGHANGDLVALAFLASPVTIIASTSLSDFVWALAFFVWGTLVHLSTDRHPDASGSARWYRSLLAGVLFALAIGSRLSTGFVLAALLVADGWEPAHRRRCLRTAAVTAPLAALLYVPSWLAFDRSLAFLESAEGYRGFFSNLGLFLYKNYVVAGIPLILVGLLAVPALWRALGNWRRDPMLRFALLALMATEALFFQLPWKTGHVLPCLLAALLWLGTSSLGRQRRFLWLVVAAVFVNGIVTFRPLAPDEADEATAGTWNPAITAGLLVNDVDCRRDFMTRPPSPTNIEAAWSCTLKPLRGEVEDDAAP